MYLSIIILPLLGSIVSGFFGRKVGVRGAQIITCSCVIVTTILALLAFVEVGFNNIPVTINLFRWIDSEWFNIIWGFQFDALTVSMLIPVLIISSLVHIYSIGYMSGDPHQQRFFSYLSLFTFMMIVLVTGNNYLLMFVGWEGVGVCSYLLVCFWFTRIAANQSSISALLTNRVGDCILTIGMFAVLWSLGNYFVCLFTIYLINDYILICIPFYYSKKSYNFCYNISINNTSNSFVYTFKRSIYTGSSKPFLQYDWYPKNDLGLIGIIPNINSSCFDLEFNKFYSLLLNKNRFIEFYIYASTRNNGLMSHLSRNIVKYSCDDLLYESFLKIYKPHISHKDRLGYHLINSGEFTNSYGFCTLSDFKNYILKSNGHNNLTYKLNKPLVLKITKTKGKGIYLPYFLGLRDY